MHMCACYSVHVVCVCVSALADQQSLSSEVGARGSQEVAATVLNECARHVNVVMSEVVKTELVTERERE